VLAVRNILPSVTYVDPRDAIVLGAPVGSDVIIDTVLLGYATIKSFGAWHAERLKNLNTHDAFYVLNICFSLSTLVYTLRSAPCYGSQNINHDDSIRSILQAILI